MLTADLLDVACRSLSRRAMFKRYLFVLWFAAFCTVLPGRCAPPEYSIQAIHYATSPNVATSDLVVGGPSDKIDVALVACPQIPHTDDTVQPAAVVAVGK